MQGDRLAWFKFKCECRFEFTIQTVASEVESNRDKIILGDEMTLGFENDDHKKVTHIIRPYKRAWVGNEFRVYAKHVSEEVS